MEVDEIDLINIFEDLLRENRLTKEIITKSKQNIKKLFGLYHVPYLSGSNGVYIVSFYKPKDEFDLSSDGPDLVFDLVDKDIYDNNCFDLLIYKSKAMPDYPFLDGDKPFLINISVIDGHLTLKHADIEVRF